MSNGTERVRAVLISSLPRAGRPAQNYNHFARETATFLSQAGRALTISPLPFKKDRSTGHKQVYTLRLAFRDAGGINVENPGEHVDLADRLSQLKIERIVLKSGVAENAITSLTSLIMRSPLPTRQDLERFQRPCIEIVFRQAPTQPSVPITAPPARIEVQPAVASPAPSLTPPVQTASKELTVPAPVVTQPVSEAAQPALGNLSAEELLSSGRQLNKRLLQKGLTSGIRTEIESWLSAAKARIDIFNKSGEAKDYGDHRKLAEQINKFEVRLGIEKTKIEVKLPARPVEVKRRRGPHKWEREMRYLRPEPTTTQPAAETFQPANPTCPRRCNTLEKLLGTLTWLENLSKEWSTNYQREVLLESWPPELIHWFEYLLQGNHLKEEYGSDLTPFVTGRIQNALKYMKDILKPVPAAAQLLIPAPVKGSLSGDYTGGFWPGRIVLLDRLKGRHVVPYRLGPGVYRDKVYEYIPTGILDSKGIEMCCTSDAVVTLEKLLAAIREQKVFITLPQTSIPDVTDRVIPANHQAFLIFADECIEGSDYRPRGLVFVPYEEANRFRCSVEIDQSRLPFYLTIEGFNANWTTWDLIKAMARNELLAVLVTPQTPPAPAAAQPAPDAAAVPAKPTRPPGCETREGLSKMLFMLYYDFEAQRESILNELMIWLKYLLEGDNLEREYPGPEDHIISSGKVKIAFFYLEAVLKSKSTH